MKQLSILSLILLLLWSPGSALAAQGSFESVALDSGPVSGTPGDGAYAFLGIPYAAPPVGDLRWRPPQAVAPWQSVRVCADFGPACPQPRQNPAGRYSEDCLYLNVWTPARGANDKLPVMLWIHGGGYNFGSADMAEYHGLRLAQKGVVVVTINYRLGPLGFLVHPRLSQESPQGVSGNYGLLDQIAALKWVQRNISGFGGDPGNVTVFGQSAGSRSVSLLMISPLAQGLFQRAIAQSGGPILGSEYLHPVFNGDMASVSLMGRELSVRLGCEVAADTLAALRKKPAQEVIKAADCKTTLFDDYIFFAPVFDGWVLPPNPLAAFTLGRQHKVPMIVGSTLNEGTIYLAGEKGLTLAKYETFMRARFGAKAQEARAVFPARGDGEVAGAIDRLITVAANAQPARIMAGAMARQGVKAYVYHFTRRPNSALARKLAVHHGVDLAYVFGNLDEPGAYDDADQALARTVMAYWVNFARTGDPNGQGLPAWPVYDSAGDLSLELGDSVSIRQHLYKPESDFIDKISRYGAQN